MSKANLIAILDARIAELKTSRSAICIAAKHKDCIRNWARDLSNPHYDTLCELADVMGLDGAVLWAIYKNKPPPPSAALSDRLDAMESLVGKVADAVLGRKNKIR